MSADQEDDLDVLSPQFNPLKALVTCPSKIQLPFPDIQPCDNLQMYGQVLQGTRRAYTAPKQESPEPSVDRDVAIVDKSKPVEPLYFEKSVLHFIKKTDSGPFQLLKSCLEDRTRVRVWTRHCVGVRGVCEGVLLAYDKHMNIVIGDVTEHFSPFRTFGNGGVDKKRKKRKKKKTTDSFVDVDQVTPTTSHVTKGCCHMIQNLSQLDSKCLKRLFIRGDNVVLISPISTKHDDQSVS